MAFKLSSRLEGYKNKKQLLGFITNNGDFFAIIVFDSNTNELVASDLYPLNAKNFIDELPSFKSLFKAFIIDLFHGPLTTYDEYCRRLREKFHELQIPNYFLTEQTYLFTSLLIGANVEMNVDDTILLIFPHKDATPENAKKTFKFTVAELKFTPNGYKIIKTTVTQELNLKAAPKLLFQQICGTSTFQNVVILPFHRKNIQYKKIFKSAKKLIILDESMDVYRKDFVIETCNWLLDKSYIKYHILPVCERSLHCYGYYGSDNHILDILKFDMYEPLPLTRSAIFTKSIPELRIVIEDLYSKVQSSKRNTKLPDADEAGHAFEITLTFDEENFTDIDIQVLAYKKFGTLPARFNILEKSKIPIIVFFDNSSAIAIHKKGNGYGFLKEWNGMFGTDCFISFDEKKPKYGKAAMETIKEKNTFVVFDLLKIMSMPKDEIKMDKTWGFTFTKDSVNPVLLKFDYFDGKKTEKKESSPDFLMALFLRQHFKAIETEIGEKPEKVAFWILGHKFTEDGIQRIRDCLEESCRRLRTDCRFVNLTDFDADFIKIPAV